MGYRKIKKSSVKNLLLAFVDYLKIDGSVPSYVYIDLYRSVDDYMEIHDEVYMDVECPNCNKKTKNIEKNGKTNIETA